jgi:hypothetical protein
LKNVVDILNDTPYKFEKVSRTKLFAKTEVRLSPQFHVKFDDVFETVKGVTEALHGRWKIVCGFTSSEVDVSTKVDSKVTKVMSPKPPYTNHMPEQLPVPGHDLEGEIPPEPPPEPDGEVLVENEGANHYERGQIDQNNQTQAAPTVEPTRRSFRSWKPTMAYLESIQQEVINLLSIPVCMELLCYDGEEEETECPLSMIAKADEDTMYWDQAMKQPDSDKFLEAAFDEIKTHEDKKHWEVVPIEDLPENTPVLDPVWSMKRKRRLKTNEVYKHKARLNIHGGYWETYAPVVT